MWFMTIFTWLVLGHLIGDWMLQNDWMARDKRGRWWSNQCIIHCLVYSITILVVAWLSSGRALTLEQVYLLFSIIFFSHWLIDGFNLASHWGRIVNQTQNESVRIVVDQTMHLLVLGVMASLIFP